MLADAGLDSGYPTLDVPAESAVELASDPRVSTTALCDACWLVALNRDQ